MLDAGDWVLGNGPAFCRVRSPCERTANRLEPPVRPLRLTHPTVLILVQERPLAANLGCEGIAIRAEDGQNRADVCPPSSVLCPLKARRVRACSDRTATAIPLQDGAAASPPHPTGLEKRRHSEDGGQKTEDRRPQVWSLRDHAYAWLVRVCGPRSPSGTGQFTGSTVSQ